MATTQTERRGLYFIYVFIACVAALMLYLVILRPSERQDQQRPIRIKASHVYSPTGGDDPGNGQIDPEDAKWPW